MDITVYVERLRGDLVAAAATGGDAMVDAAERLTVAFDAAVRMALLEALSDAAAEITGELGGGAVELRLKGREPQFVVTRPTESAADVDDRPAADDPLDDDAAATARVTLRLPEGLKQRVDDAAARSRQSTNTWLVEAIRTAIAVPETGRWGRGRHVSGWVR